MLFWIGISLIVFLALYLSIVGTTTVSHSEIHTSKQKRNYILLIWIFPIIGTFVVIALINRDIKKQAEKAEEKIAPMIKDLADQISLLDAAIQKKKGDKSIH